MITKFTAIIIIISIVAGVYFGYKRLETNRENDIRAGAYAECEAEREKTKNSMIEASQRIIIAEQEAQLILLDKQRKYAVEQAKQNAKRAGALNKKIRNLENVEEINCASISNESLCLLNKSACIYNKSIGDNCEC